MLYCNYCYFEYNENYKTAKGVLEEKIEKLHGLLWCHIYTKMVVLKEEKKLLKKYLISDK